VTISDVLYRLATSEDYPAILRLQAANYIENLSPEERKQGFLSAQFSPAQISEMAGDLGITIALIENNVAGFLCAFRNEFDHGSPVLVKMFESYERVRFEGKPLSSYKSYAYGPVCIGREYRQRGLLRGLYEAQKKELAGQFDIGVAFVSRGNPHSLRAHVSGLAMTEVGDFEAKGNIYVILAFSLAPTPEL
jgi:predicted GNAT superfamily acetyltransferase